MTGASAPSSTSEGSGAGPGHGVQGDARGDAGVEGLELAGHRDRDELVAGLGHQAREAGGLRADDEHERPVAEVEVGQADVTVGREADHHEPASL